jgi:outer membrane immunogenic protein
VLGTDAPDTSQVIEEQPVRGTARWLSNTPRNFRQGAHERGIILRQGYALMDNQLSITGPAAAFSESHMHSGWTIGGGLEYMFVPNWSAKVEYMFADYSNATYLSAFAPGGIGLGLTVNTVKAGVNYHFGGPVVARY